MSKDPNLGTQIGSLSEWKITISDPDLKKL